MNLLGPDHMNALSHVGLTSQHFQLPVSDSASSWRPADVGLDGWVDLGH